ncbi:MAG: LysR family transcriptional regulator [Hyphomicrobiaceae bacterium]|nr:MAG: LysR family transcriptional regulator [Hyphomicrobiaceae bacterium]
MHGFDWNDLRYFLAIARSGKLTTAARQLGVDHTTVSRRVAALEEGLKATLFERSPHGYKLTDAGERLMAHAEMIETAAHQALSDIGEADLSLTGSVRIGAPDGFGSIFLAPRLWTLCRRHPGLEIDLVAMPRQFSLSKREADVAIVLARPTTGRLKARRLTDYLLGLFASKDYLARRSPILKPADLKDHRLIGYIEDMIFTPELDYLPLIEKDLKTNFASTNLIAQLNATRAGAGVCVLPYFMTAGIPELVPVLPRDVRIRRTFWLITHADLAGMLRVRVTSDFIAEEAQKAKSLFLPDG